MICTFIHLFVWLCLLLWLGRAGLAGTLGISTSAKIMLLWLQCRGRAMHAAAATATVFSQNLITLMKYCYFYYRIYVFLIKTNEKKHFGLGEPKLILFLEKYKRPFIRITICMNYGFLISFGVFTPLAGQVWAGRLRLASSC